MKNSLKHRLTTLIMLLFCLAGSVEIANAQVFAVNPGDSVNVFGPVQEMIVAGQSLKVRTKLVRHFGTTCQFEIEITNDGSKYFMSRSGIVSLRTDALHMANSVVVNLKPGYYATYKMEGRECLKKGIKDPMVSCLACNPRIGFYNPKVK